MEIRRYKSGEEPEIWSVFYGAMRSICSRDYTWEQISKWAPNHKDMTEWSSRLAEKNPFVAVVDSTIAGYAELESNGHIDHFYCHKDFQGRGIGTALLDRVEAEAQRSGLNLIFAEVSVTAFPFFAAKGFDVTEERENIVCAAPAKQYLMRKKIKHIKRPSG